MLSRHFPQDLNFPQDSEVPKMSDLREAYLARFRRVLDHIDAHLDETLSVERLSAVAAFSPFHFHRQFAALSGMGVGRYVQLRRLDRAARQLAFRKVTVMSAALDAGYDGPEAFARAFKQAGGQSPSAFRKQANWEAWHAAMSPLNPARSQTMTPPPVDITHFPETSIALMLHTGDARRVPETVQRFIAWRRHSGLSPRSSATFNLLYDDPETVAAADYRFGLAAGMNDASRLAANDAGVVADVLPAGRCAVVRHSGPDASLFATVNWLFRDWLPASGENLRDVPIVIQRLSVGDDTPDHLARADIFLALR